jgi:TolB protein
MRKYLIIAVLLIAVINVLKAQNSQKDLIAFSSDATKEDKQQIFVMDMNGDGVKQVAHVPGLDCYAPKFSPGGNKIVFSATNVKSDYIYIVDLDDTASFRSPKFIDGGTNPHFSNDGRYLVYRAEKNDDNAIFLMDLTTDSSYNISDGSLSTHPQFSADGSKIIYSSSANGNFDLVVLNLDDTSENAQKTIASTKDAELYGTFSPDGSHIAYASFDINYKGVVHVCGPDGKSNKAVTSGGSAYNPKFSPDGSQLAFVWDKGGGYEVFVCNSDGTGVKQLTNKKGNTVEFDWSANSKKIVYESSNDDLSSINVIDLETGKKDDLTGSKANNINPSFQK